MTPPHSRSPRSSPDGLEGVWAQARDGWRRFQDDVRAQAAPAVQAVAGVGGAAQALADTITAQARRSLLASGSVVKAPVAPKPTPPGPRTNAIPLRGAQDMDRPAGRPDYLGDLTDPAVQRFMTTPAAKPGMAYIDRFPATGLGVRTSVRQLQAGLADVLAGKRIRPWPEVSFENDDPHGASPRQPLTAETAGMVAGAIADSGLRAVNVNSTTGGVHGPGSRHYSGQAVDINRVEGQPVGSGPKHHTRPNPDPDVVADVAALQNALRRQLNIGENFGPAFQEKRWRRGAAPHPAPSTKDDHGNHVHAATVR